MAFLNYVILCALFGLGTAQLSPLQPDPCNSKFKVVGDETHCDRYWKCVGGKAQLTECPNGLAYVGARRGIAGGCDYPWRGIYCDVKPRNNAPISTEHCEWLYGVFGHETSCTRYWTCWNGTSTEQFCIGGLLYNEETHACDWPQNVQGCQKHPLCREDPNANVPLGKSCERYWSCQGGYPRLQRCPATLVFDKLTRRCVAPPTIDCEVPTTTPHPAQEELPFNPNESRPRPLIRNQSRRRGDGQHRRREEAAVVHQEELFNGEESPVGNIRILGDDRIRRPNRHDLLQPIIFNAPDSISLQAQGSDFRQSPIEGAILLN